MKRYLLLTFLLLAALMAVQVGSAASIIVINETEPDVVSIQKIIVTGDLSTNTLRINGGGEVLSEGNAKVYLFGPSDDIVIRNLFVGGSPTTVSFDKNGYFFLADEGSFGFVADMEIRTIGQVRLYVPGPINELDFDIDHGYVVDGDRFGVFQETVIIQRSEKVAMQVTGNFRFTYAQRDQFSYTLSFRSFGSTLGRYTLDLPNGETVSSVSGAIKWEQIGDRLILDLQGSTATVFVNGIFNSQNLQIPLKEDSHHVVIESDPEKKIGISTGAKEIDISEAGINTQYANGRAFLADQFDRFAVTIKELGLLPSLAASVRQATNTVAVTDKGSVVGQLDYNYANTGHDYLEVDAPGDVLYASTARGAVKLTAEDKLLLSFPKSEYGSLSVVYFDTVGKLLPIDYVSVPLASTDLPITEMSSRIYLPGDTFVLHLFGAKGGSDIPSLKSIALFVILLGFLGWLLISDRKFVAAYVAFAAGVLIFDSRFFMLLVGISIFLKVRAYISRGSLKWILAGAGLLLAAGLFFYVLSGAMSLFGGGVSYASESYDMGADYAMVEEAASAPMMRGLTKLGDADDGGAMTVPVRTGVLPVRLDIPRLGKMITVQNHLVTKENPVELGVLIASSWLKYVLVVLALFPGLYCYRTYRDRPEQKK